MYIFDYLQARVTLCTTQITNEHQQDNKLRKYISKKIKRRRRGKETIFATWNHPFNNKFLFYGFLCKREFYGMRRHTLNEKTGESWWENCISPISIYYFSYYYYCCCYWLVKLTYTSLSWQIWAAFEIISLITACWRQYLFVSLASSHKRSER